MGLIVLIIIIAVVIVVIRKRKKGDVDYSSKPNESGSQQQHTDFGFLDVLYKDTEERTTKFTELINSNPELKKTYNKIYEVFIPTKYASDIKKMEFKGYITTPDDKDRAKLLEKAHNQMMEICGNDEMKYALFFDTMYDNLLKDMFNSTNKGLADSANYVLQDVKFGDLMIDRLNIYNDIFNSGGTFKSKIKTDEGKIKIHAYTKNDKLMYEVEGLYKSACEGFNMTDYMIRNAEILMAISKDYDYYLYPIKKDDLVKNKIGMFKSKAEKYNLPNTSWMKEHKGTIAVFSA